MAGNRIVCEKFERFSNLFVAFVEMKSDPYWIAFGNFNKTGIQFAFAPKPCIVARFVAMESSVIHCDLMSLELEAYDLV